MAAAAVSQAVFCARLARVPLSRRSLLRRAALPRASRFLDGLRSPLRLIITRCSFRFGGGAAGRAVPLMAKNPRASTRSVCDDTHVAAVVSFFFSLLAPSSSSCGGLVTDVCSRRASPSPDVPRHRPCQRGATASPRATLPKFGASDGPVSALQRGEARARSTHLSTQHERGRARIALIPALGSSACTKGGVCGHAGLRAQLPSRRAVKVCVLRTSRFRLPRACARATRWGEAAAAHERLANRSEAMTRALAHAPSWRPCRCSCVRHERPLISRVRDATTTRAAATRT